jgi:hypothetical protein
MALILNLCPLSKMIEVTYFFKNEILNCVQYGGFSKEPKERKVIGKFELMEKKKVYESENNITGYRGTAF